MIPPNDLALSCGAQLVSKLTTAGQHFSQIGKCLPVDFRPNITSTLPAAGIAAPMIGYDSKELRTLVRSLNKQKPERIIVCTVPR